MCVGLLDIYLKIVFCVSKMSRTSMVTQTFDDMEGAVSKLLEDEPDMCSDKLCITLCTEGHQCVIVEKGWYLYQQGRGASTPFRKIAHKDKFHVYARSFLVARAKPNSNEYIHDREAMFVIIEK